MEFQSDPLRLRPYAKISPSSENFFIDSEVVPSSDKVFGSKKILGSDSNVSWTNSTLHLNTKLFSNPLLFSCVIVFVTYGFEDQSFYRRSNDFPSLLGKNILENSTAL